MDYKKIQEQIARQTKPNLGFVQVVPPKGVAFYREKPRPADVVEPEFKSFVWYKVFYIFDRSSPDGENYQYHIVPVYNKEIYSKEYSNYQYLKDYFDFTDVWDNNHENVKIYYENLNGGISGSFNDIDLYHYFNGVYTINIPPQSNQQNKTSSIKVSIAAKDISVSVWVKEYYAKTNVVLYRDLCLYTSGQTGLMESWADITFPIGLYGSDLMIFVYNHDPLRPYVPPGRHRPSGIPEYVGEVTNHYFKVLVDFNKYDVKAAKTNFTVVKKPSWSALAVTSSCDAITGNVINTLNFNRPSNDVWNTISVYRRETISSIKVNKHLDNTSIYNTILLNTANSNVFAPGSYISLGATSESLKGCFTCYGNKVLNPGFCNYTGSTLDNWVIYNSSASKCTSYPYKENYKFDGQSLKLTTSTTNNASPNKTYYIQSGYLPVSTASWLSFWYRLDSGNPIGVVKTLFYKSTYSTCGISSAVYGGFDNNGWDNAKYQFNSLSTSCAYYLPTDCSFVKVRFYSTWNHSAKAHYLLDGFHCGEMAADYIFHESTVNHVAVNLYNRFENPRNNFTRFHAYYKNTTQSLVYSTCYASTVFGKNYYVSSAWDNWCKFDSGILCADTAKNYLWNSNFVSSVRKWSTSGGFYYSWISQSSSSYDKPVWYNTGFARFTGINQIATLTQSTSGGTGFANTTWTFGLWAKSRYGQQPMILHLQDARSHISTAHFNLSTCFAPYYITTTFASGGNTAYAKVVVYAGSNWEIDINGTQLEKAAYISQYNYHSTASGSTRGYGGLKYSNIQYISDELITDINDRTFAAAAPGWANAGLSAYNEVGDLSITSNGASQYAALTKTAYGGCTIGKTYRIQCDYDWVSGNWQIQTGGTGANEIFGILGVSDVVGKYFDKKITKTEANIIVVNTITVSQANLDNFSLKAIQAAVNPDYGTIRFWYTPTVDYNKGLDYRYLFNCTAGPTQIGIYYDKVSSCFAFKQRYTSSSNYSTVAAIFNAGTNYHIAAVWDTAACTLYVDGVAGKSFHNLATTFPKTFFVGINTSKSYSANGVLSNYRIDHTKWTRDIIRNDYYSANLLYSSGIALTIYKDQQVGKKDASRSESLLSFIDDNGLEVNRQYDYVFRVLDQNGNLSEVSSVQSVVTPRKSFELEHRNRIINSSFEVLRPSGFPEHWTNFAGVESTASYRFINTRCVSLGNNGVVLSSKMDATDTSYARVFSFHLYGAHKENFWTGLYYLDSKMQTVKIAPNSSYTSYANTNFTRSDVVGADGNIWTRYSTSLPAIQSSASYSNVAYVYAGFLNLYPTGYVYLDAVQYESASLTPYRETYYISDVNFPDGVIKGNAVSYDSIIGKHFKEGAIVISTGESDSNRLVLGSEGSANSYTVMSYDSMKWHAPNLDSGAGWNYVKHIESGEGNFGTNVIFSQRYYNFVGDLNPSPMVLVSPKRFLTYSTVSNVSQTLDIVLNEVTANGFIANAYLYGGAAPFWNQTLNGFLINSTPHTWGIDIDTDNSDTDEWGATVLPLGSKNKTGTLRYNLYTWWKTGDLESVIVTIYGTSVATHHFIPSTWRLLATRNHYDPGIINQNFDVTISTAAFSRTTSLAIRVQTDNGSATSVDVSVNPDYLNYATATSTLLKTNSQIGSFNWIALDGGIME